MLLHACGVFEALPGRLGGLQEPPGASRGLQGFAGAWALAESPKKPRFERKMRPPRTAKASNLAEAEISRGMVRLD